MSEQRIILIENPCYLSVDTGRIKLSRPEMPDTFILSDDIAVLCIHHPAITISQSVLQALGKSKSVLITTDKNHHPQTLTLPWYGHSRQLQRLKQQFSLQDQNNEINNILWQQLIQARLRTQAQTLRFTGKKGALRLERLATQVTPGDPKILEGQGAKHYWKYLFDEGEGDIKKRQKQGATDTLNVRLNFGYAILRSMIARELAIAGLQPALGIGHHNQDNPFNLADDFIEAYRFAVETWVIQHDHESDFDAKARQQLLQFITQSLKIKKQTYRLPSAITETVGSYCRILKKAHKKNKRSEKLKLTLPEKQGDSWPQMVGV